MKSKTNPDEKDAYALIVGISTYEDSKIPKLNYTTHDAQAIFDLLVNPDIAGFKKENVKFLLDDKATLYNIKNAITNWLFKNAKEDSMVFIFFAGHGCAEEDRSGTEKDNIAKYLLPYDAKFDNLFASALSSSDFNKLLRFIKSRRLVVFMDSCYSGGVSERKARDVKILEDPYKKMAEGAGRLVIAASKHDQRSFEDETLSHGIFTHHLIEALKGAADLDKDGYVTAMEVYNYLNKTVPETARRLTGGVQEPILRGDFETDFVLTVSRKRLEAIKHEDRKKKNRLFDWYYDEKLDVDLYELARRLIGSSSEDLSEDDKKVLKLLNDLLSNKISILTFQQDVRIIKGLEEPPIAKPEFDEEEEKKKRIIELSSQAQKLFVEKKYTEAIEKWQEVLKLDSENREAIRGIEEAERILEDIAEKKGKINELNLSAQQLYREEKYEEAIDEWKKVLDIDLENQEAKEEIKKVEQKLKEKEREVSEVGVVSNLAGLGTRFAAFLIDVIIIGLVSLFLAVLLFDAVPLSTPEKEVAVLIIMGILISMLYFTYFFGTTGQTPGKQVMKIKVVTVDGSPLTYGKSFMRWIGYMVACLTLGIGFLLILIDKNKQGFEDMVAGTYVVKA